jgi:nucleoside phosphorylase
MIRIERPDAPEVFSKAALRAYEVRRTSEWFAVPPEQRPRRKFDFRSAGEIPGFMDRLGGLFFNKCAFCETKFVDAEAGALAFFRPREAALQLDGTTAPDHYWWLSWEWSNLYLACVVCIHAKGQMFPTKKQRARPETHASDLQSEEPVLLDPCLDDPDRHLVFGEDGEVAPRDNSQRGLVTIDTFGLNRGGLLSARRERAWQVREILLKCFQATAAGDSTLTSLIEELRLYCSDGQPFAGMARQLLRGWLWGTGTSAALAPDVPVEVYKGPNWHTLLDRLGPQPGEDADSIGDRRHPTAVEAVAPGRNMITHGKEEGINSRNAMDWLPKNLVKAVKEGRVIPFAGAGVAMALRGLDGNPIVSDWSGLLGEAAGWLDENHLRGEAEVLRKKISLDPTFAGAFLTAHEALGTEELLNFLQERLDPPREAVADGSLGLARVLWRLSSNFVVTIGHDHSLQWACPDRSALELLEAAQVPDAVRNLDAGLPRPVLWYAFGTLEGGNPIITFDGVQSLLPDPAAEAKLSATGASLQELFAGPYPVLFVGTSAPRFFAAHIFGKAKANHIRHYWLVRQDVFEECQRSLQERALSRVIQPVAFPDYESLPSLLDQLASVRPYAVAVGPAVKRSSPSPGPTTAPKTVNRPEDSDGEVPEPYTFDIAIVCALREPELEKVLETGTELWEEVPQERNDPHTYHRNVYTTRKGNRLRVVAAAPNQMGLAASAVLATKIILRFRPKLVAMVGIAAGVKSESQGFGDILAAEHTFDYGAGKEGDKKGNVTFKPDPKPLDIDTALHARLKEWQAEGYELDNIRRNWPAAKPRTALALHVGPLGSGAAVVDSRRSVKRVMEHWRKLIGIEMEAYAVHRACKDAVAPAPMYLCLKSICDFAENKDDAWQPYAAFTAAQLCYRFLTAEWENLFG